MTNPDNVGRLLPCPFCGHDESLYIEHVEGTIRHPAYYVRCDYCGAQTGSTDSGEHVKKWNERAELCRAAPAGGDWHAGYKAGYHDAHLGHNHSAPAGSGEVDGLADTLVRMADNAYCDYIRKMQRPECLGWEEKVRRGSFDSENLRAHVGAGELLGRHRALHEAAALLRKLQQGAEC